MKTLSDMRILQGVAGELVREPAGGGCIRSTLTLYRLIVGFFFFLIREGGRIRTVDVVEARRGRIR